MHLFTGNEISTAQQATRRCISGNPDDWTTVNLFLFCALFLCLNLNIINCCSCIAFVLTNCNVDVRKTVLGGTVIVLNRAVSSALNRIYLVT